VGKKDEAGTALRDAFSALVKGVLSCVIRRGSANLMLSRLRLRLATLK
jgi:hypothetical protein